MSFSIAILFSNIFISWNSFWPMPFVVYKTQLTQENTCSKFINDHDLEASLPTHYPPPGTCLPFENRRRVWYTEKIQWKKKITLNTERKFDFIGDRQAVLFRRKAVALISPKSSLNWLRQILMLCATKEKQKCCPVFKSQSSQWRQNNVV